MSKQKAIRLSVICATAFAVILLAGWIILSNLFFDVTEIELSHNSLPNEFDGFKIAQLSDIHNADCKDIIAVLKAQSPDIIVITGDLIDSPDMENAVSAVFEAQKIAPCYYVTGNHEAWVEDHVFSALESELISAGVTVLRNSYVSIESKSSKIRIVGVHDPDFDESGINSLDTLCDDGTFTVLLSHRPELFDIYVSAGAELVLSGHAHGGQFRIPFLGGVYAPHQGIFPKYDAGIYTEGQTNMYVSRGIGHSGFPFRINNSPEIVFVTLKCQ